MLTGDSVRQGVAAGGRGERRRDRRKGRGGVHAYYKIQVKQTIKSFIIFV